MSDGQGDVMQQIGADNLTTGPPMAYQATGGINWQHGDGWGYQPLNRAAIAQRARRVSRDMQDLANAVGGGYRTGGGNPMTIEEELQALRIEVERLRKQCETRTQQRDDAIRTQQRLRARLARLIERYTSEAVR